MNTNTSHLSHLSNDELIALLYEAAPANLHAASCPHCQDRLRAMRLRQLSDRDSNSDLVAGRRLAIQRANIYARLDSRPSMLGSRWLWAGAPMAAAAALLMTVSFGTLGPFHQAPVPTPESKAAVQSVNAGGDTLYADIYQQISLEAPAGVNAVAGMFEVANSETAKTGSVE